jgi:hypothetical protein
MQPNFINNNINHPMIITNNLVSTENYYHSLNGIYANDGGSISLKYIYPSSLGTIQMGNHPEIIAQNVYPFLNYWNYHF